MTWHATEMPDSALDPASYVGRMLRSTAEDSSVVQEPPSTAEPMPLWEAMRTCTISTCLSDLDGTDGANMIEALRDWLLPEEPEMPQHGPAARSFGTPEDWLEAADRRDERQRLRAILTEQARIARGEQ